MEFLTTVCKRNFQIPICELLYLEGNDSKRMYIEGLWYKTMEGEF